MYAGLASVGDRVVDVGAAGNGRDDERSTSGVDCASRAGVSTIASSTERALKEGKRAARLREGVEDMREDVGNVVRDGGKSVVCENNR